MCDFSKITYLSYLRYLDLFFPKKTCAYLDLDKNKKYHRSYIVKGISLSTIAVQSFNTEIFADLKVLPVT